MLTFYCEVFLSHGFPSQWHHIKLPLLSSTKLFCLSSNDRSGHESVRGAEGRFLPAPDRLRQVRPVQPAADDRVRVRHWTRLQSGRHRLRLRRKRARMQQASESRLANIILARLFQRQPILDMLFYSVFRQRFPIRILNYFNYERFAKTREIVKRVYERFAEELTRIEDGRRKGGGLLLRRLCLIDLASCTFLRNNLSTSADFHEVLFLLLHNE